MLDALQNLLSRISRPIVAVSGGVDSVTLGAVASALYEGVLLVHAVSPAVPGEATARLKGMAEERSWRLEIIGTGEFDDPRYRANPVNRCFFCKTNLYAAIRAYVASDRPILSGANLDDLGEYRPGLDAARLHRVRHPYIEAGIDKQGVRAIARHLGLREVAELPSSPCLASRVETGIRIESTTLAFIHRVERLVSARIRPATVRCRVRAKGIVVELDSASLGNLSEDGRAALTTIIGQARDRPAALPISFEPYRNGSAFLTQSAP